MCYVPHRCRVRACERNGRECARENGVILFNSLILCSKRPKRTGKKEAKDDSEDRSDIDDNAVLAEDEREIL